MPNFNSDEPTLGLIITSISKVKFCIDISYVNAIFNPLQFRAESIIDNGEDSFISVNNYIFPVIELNPFFNLKSRPITSLTRMILIEYNHTQFAFYVDEIKEIIAFNKKKLDEIKFSEFTNNNGFIRAILNYQDNYYILPNFNTIIKKIKNYSPTIIN